MFLLENDSLLQVIDPYLRLIFTLVFTFTLLLGIRYKRNRLIFCLLLLGLAAGRYLLYPDQPELSSVLMLLLPLNIALILLWPEKRLSNPLTALLGTLILSQGLVLLWVVNVWPEHFFSLLRYPIPFSLPLPDQPGILHLASLFISVITVFLCFRLRPTPVEAAFFWMFLLTLIPFYFQFGTQKSLLFFCLAVLTLLAGLLESSHHMAYRDELTGIPGRRALNETLNRLGKRYALAMIDIDHFKKFNDKHGHEVGDQVLKMVARRLVSVGGGGRAFRYGGEEFAVVFPDRSAEEILPELEKLRQNVASARFIPRGKDRPEKKPKTTPRKSSPTKSLSVTISIGAAEPSSQKRSPEQVMVGADQALYRAKQQGRNRVCS